jgi:hypothetical protein
MMDIFQFTQLMHDRLEKFEEFWLEQHSKNPSQYPFVLSNDNNGLWWEMFEQFTEDNQQ